MKRALCLALAAGVTLLLSGAAPAAVIEHNLVVEPDFVHCDVCHGGSSVFAITSSLLVPVPDVTLAPGDLLRITLEFTNGKFLKRVPPTSAVHELGIQLFITRNGEEYGAAAEGVDGSRLTQVFDEQSQLVLENFSQPSVHFVEPRNESLQYTLLGISDYLYPDESVGPTVHTLLFELQMPTFIQGFNSSFPFHTTTFAGNWIDISYTLYQYDSPPSSNVAVYVVPEPETLSLIGAVAIAAVCFRCS